VKLKPLQSAPVLITGGVIALVGLVRLAESDSFERLERMTYDSRVRAAQHFPQPAAANLGFVFMSDDSIAALNNGSLGFRYGLYWPRQIYGRLARELTAQGAKAVAFDVLFRELRKDHAQVPVATKQWPDLPEFLTALHPGQPPASYQDQGETITLAESDEYFAWQLHRSGRAVLAAERDILPHPLFATNASALADVYAERDPDGVLRRAKAFEVVTNWHFAFRQVAADPGYHVDLARARVEPGQIVLPRTSDLGDTNVLAEIKVPLDSDGNFSLADFGGAKLPPGVPLKAKPFALQRLWHMGIVLAARELQLDLDRAEVDLDAGRITLRGTNGVQRILPVDRHGYFYINWELPPSDPRLTKDSVESVLAQDLARSAGQTEGLTNRWRGRLAIIGSSATGNDLTDRGATPLQADTLLASKHWNVANSVLTGRFVRRSSLTVDLLLIAALGMLAALITWRLRTLLASGLVVILLAAYAALGLFLYVQFRYWLPLALPLLGALLMTHVCIVTWRVVFEQAERRRVRSVFSKIVSPNIVQELLGAENLALGGARREVTVLFADVRGFTEFTDRNQDRAAAYVEAHQLTGAAMESYFDEQARDTLLTVNAYLSRVADTVKHHAGTLDKYIGDCVMAFWGAPTPNLKHAAACVHAAMDAQRAIYAFNRERLELNQRRVAENPARVAAGLEPLPLLPYLLLGTGINTGMVTVGLMGSEAHISNYTVFGREVNLASRLESVSGRGRIVISENTYEHLRRDDPALAATCLPLPVAAVKGFRTAVKIYEVPWRPPGSVPLDTEFATAADPVKPELDPARRT